MQIAKLALFKVPMNLRGRMRMSFLQATGDESAIWSQAVCVRDINMIIFTKKWIVNMSGMSQNAFNGVSSSAVK